MKDWWTKIKSWPINDVIKHKHRFVVLDSDTYKEKFSFQLSGANLFVTLGITMIVLIILTTVLIAFTPLRELIPGYTNNRMLEQTYENAKKIDSLETELANQEWLVATMQAVLKGEAMGEETEQLRGDTAAGLQQVAAVYRRSKEDSLLRLEVEQEDNRYQVKATSQQSSTDASAPAVSHLMFAPLKGKILNAFDPAKRHNGVDIAGATNQTVNAAYGGTVIMAAFTAEAGHVIALQHPGNVVSVYRNNGVLLKHQGDMVRVGEPIAYVGSAARPELGPYLHFELWVAGAPVNPEEYISF